MKKCCTVSSPKMQEGGIVVPFCCFARFAYNLTRKMRRDLGSLEAMAMPLPPSVHTKLRG